MWWSCRSVDRCALQRHKRRSLAGGRSQCHQRRCWSLLREFAAHLHRRCVAMQHLCEPRKGCRDTSSRDSFIAGGPNSNDLGTNRVLHHTIGLADWNQEYRCFKEVTCAAVRSFQRLDASGFCEPRLNDAYCGTSREAHMLLNTCGGQLISTQWRQD